MKYVIGSVVAALAIVSAAPAAPAAAQRAPAPAQQAPTEKRDTRAELDRIVEQSGVVEAMEAVGAAVAPELERTMEALAESLNTLARRVAQDPELRSSALRAARGAVDVAEVAVVEQASVLQELLRAAADRIEAAAAAREGREPRSRD
jgi:hypothetical protein